MHRLLVLVAGGLLLTGSVAAQPGHTLNVAIGQRISLQPLGGPNVQLVINRIDQFDINLTVIDYENMRLSRNMATGYNVEQPATTTRQFRLSDRSTTRIFHRGDCTVFYVPDMNTSMNHARLEVTF